MADNLDDTTKCTVHYLMIGLSEGREVWVGYNAGNDDDRGYFFRFVRGGVTTALRLSAEATAALVRLLPEVDMYRDVQCVVKIETKTAVSGETESG